MTPALSVSSACSSDNGWETGREQEAPGLWCGMTRPCGDQALAPGSPPVRAELETHPRPVMKAVWGTRLCHVPEDGQ